VLLLLKLLEVIGLNRLLEVTCAECRARTPLDPSLFVSRRGLETSLDELERHLVCPCCGSAEIKIAAAKAIGPAAGSQSEA